MIYLIMVILILSGSFIILFNYKSYSIIEEKNKSTLVQMLQQTSLSLNHLFYSIEDVSKILASSNVLRDILIKNVSQDYTLSQQIDDYRTLSKYFADNSFNKNVDKINLYCANTAIYTKENINFFNLDVARQQSWFERMHFLNGGPLWINQKENIFCSRGILDYYMENSMIGAIQISFKQQSVNEVMEKILPITFGEIALIDLNKEIVSLLGARKSVFEDYLKSYYLNKDEKFEAILDDAEIESFVMFTPLSNGWVLAATLPKKTFLEEKKAFFISTIFISIIVILLAMLLTHIVLKNQTNRIDRIVSFMTTVDIHSSRYINEKYNDEITRIEAGLNQMLRTTRDSIASAKKANRLKKEADYNLLQEQVNPHFLYNCLDSINWMSAVRGAPEISRMCFLLGKFFRLALSGGHQFISLSDEIEHVKMYVEIMQMRFDGQISVNFDINVELNKYKIIKLILQPIVENAILHGISNREEAEGTILISIIAQSKILYISVEDDGMGMDEDRLSCLIEAIKNHNDGIGYGLRNVHQRMQLYFGKEYGIEIQSKYGIGTKVDIHMPLKEINNSLED